MSHTHLTLEERVSIEIFVSMGMSCREMARRLGRSHSTLSRELRRNAGSAKKRLSCAERRAACPQKAKETKALPLYAPSRTDHLGR